MFLRSATQWRAGSMGGVIGLDYTAVALVMDWHGVPRARRNDVAWRVQVIERGALAALHERRERP